MYARSVEKNIAYGVEEVTKDEVVTAATQANAHDFISDMKEQYDTKTGEKGSQLSGKDDFFYYILGVRDWSLVTGRGGGLKNGKITGPKLVTPPLKTG